MAENESLDLDDPYWRRWDIVFQSIRKAEPFDKVVERVVEGCTVDSATP